jgi:hypothetical protein
MYVVSNADLTDCPAPGTLACLTTNVEIARSRFEGNGRSGIAFQRGTQKFCIHDNTFENISDQSIDFEPTGTQTDGPLGDSELRPSDILIEANHFEQTNGKLTVSLGTGSDRVTFRNNTIQNGRIFIISGRDLLLEDNVIVGSTSGMPLEIRRSEGLVIRRNQIEDRRPAGTLAGDPATAIRMSPHNGGRVRDVEIAENTIIAVPGARAITAVDTDGIRISNNVINASGGEMGVSFKAIGASGQTSTGFDVNENQIQGFAIGIGFFQGDAGDPFAGVVVQHNGIDAAGAVPDAVGVSFSGIGAPESIACVGGNEFGAGIGTPITPASVPLDCTP